MKKVIFTILLFVFFTHVTLSQSNVIRGTVTDAQTGEPLAGVNVLLKDEGVGVITNEKGIYKFRVPKSGETLLFIYPGKDRKEVDINRPLINVQLGNEVDLIEEKTTVALGVDKRKVAIPFSYQEIQGEQISRKGTQSLATALQGKIVGLNVTETSGMPGSSSNISLRGDHSLFFQNEPLIVVDGLPISSGQSFNGDFNGMDYTSRINDLNLEDIESINVLRGAAAAGLYGGRGANGAIIITTKSGRNLTPGKNVMNVGQSYMVNSVDKLPKTQNSYGQGNNGIANANSSYSWGEKLEEGAAIDNMSPAFQDGYSAITHLDYAGAVQKGSYNISLGYVDQVGIIPNSNMNRINAKVGGEFKPSNKFKAGLNANIAQVEVLKLVGGNNPSSPLQGIYASPVSYDMWGQDFADPSDPYNQINYTNEFDNPRWSLNNNIFNETTDRAFGNFYFKYQPIQWLEINYIGGADLIQGNINENFNVGSTATAGRTSPPSGGQLNLGSNNSLQINSNINVKFSLGDFDNYSFDLTLGNETIKLQNTATIESGFGFEQGGSLDLPNASTTETQETSFSRTTYGFYANAAFSLKRIFFLHLAARQDYISDIAYDNSQFFNPSAGVNILFSEFFDQNNFLKVGKLKASYAKLAQAPFVNLNASDEFNFSRNSPLFSRNHVGLNPFSQLAAVNIPQTLNPQITEMMDLGFELQLFNSRFNVDFSYFEERNTNNLMYLPLSSVTGYNYELVNSGETVNTGIEGLVSIYPIKTDNFQWNISANYSQIESQVISVAPNLNQISLTENTNASLRMMEGNQYPMIYGSAFLRDAEGNIVVDGRQFVNGTYNPDFGMPIKDPEEKLLGKVNPDFRAAASSTISLYGFSIHAQFDGQMGGVAFADNTRSQQYYGVDASTQDRENPFIFDGVKGYYTQDPASGETTVNVTGENNIVINKNEYFWSNVMSDIDETNIYSTNFIRLREAKISLTIDHTKNGPSFFKKTNIFVVGRNLWMLTSFPNFDPESNFIGSGNFGGISLLNFPQMKSFGGGLSFTF